MDKVIYRVVDKTSGYDEYDFDSIRGAAKWIEELLETFECRRKDVAAYVIQYTKHGDFKSQVRFF